MRSSKQSLTIIMSTNDFMYFHLMVNIMPSGESGTADKKKQFELRSCHNNHAICALTSL